ncbi:MAG: PQQ-binding-like beta-propeller repeat protein [Acidobacteria bacterium]|nr:PQQ-binding-like beta-propeller repeat protein [Acidobacteriota bacterium]
MTMQTVPGARGQRRFVTRMGAVLTAVLCVGLCVGGTTADAQERDFEPVTDAMLQDPDPADWLNWRRTLDGWGYSPLDQIDRGNVHELQLVWGWPIGRGLSQPTPLVYDGVMYIPSPRNVVQAVDAVTGDRIWEYGRDFEAAEALEAVGAGMRTRSIAIYGDKIYVNTSDAHMVALDARTGEVAWDHTVADYRLGYRYTSGPIVVAGRIVAGMTGCQNYKNDVCFISAHDPETGEEVWRTSTIARPGEPGGDTWGDLPLTFRAGADSWIPGSYDPETNLTFWSTSQAKPWARVSRKTDGDALYTNSVLALDPATGELEWYFQFVPGETHDLDDVFESVLIDHRGRRSLFKMGKHGILWELDRATGAFVAAHDLGYQDVLDVDPGTGEVTYRPEMIPVAGVELAFCPDFGGIRNWRASAYHPGTQLLYIPIHPTCVRGMFTELEQVEGNDYYANRGWFSRGSTVHPASGEHAGHLIAMDIDTGEIRWRHSTATRPGTAALTTAGGLVVSADSNRHLFIHDVETGAMLFETRLPASAQGFPITYAVDGRQYLAIPVGGDRTNAIYAFALPERSAASRWHTPAGSRDVRDGRGSDRLAMAHARGVTSHRVGRRFPDD